MTKPSIWCVCMGFGYPGLAPATRITMIGRALQATGCNFRVCHLGANPLREVQDAGTHEGIPYRYYPSGVSYSKSRFKRRITYLGGLRQLAAEIATAHRRKEQIIIYAWLQTNLATVLFRCWLRRMSIPIVKENNEWFPGFKAHINRLISTAQSDGLLVISEAIEERVKRMIVGRRKPILKVPVLTDVLSTQAGDFLKENDPYLLWCGNAASSSKDIRFMLDVMAQAIKRKPTIRLVIAGRTTDQFVCDVQALSRDRGIPVDSVGITGYLPDDELFHQMREANGLLLPLWADEERSVCRFPTKLAEYLATARPVITSPVGEVGNYLQAGYTAFICPSGDVNAYADAVEMVLNEPLIAAEIGLKGRKVAERNFDFRAHRVALHLFFTSMLQQSDATNFGKQ